MKRLCITFLGLTACVMLSACGGGTAATPDTNNDGNSLIVDVQGTGGGRTVSYVPGKLDLHFGGTAEDLAGTVARYGYQLEFTRGSWAGVDIGGADPQAAIAQLEKDYNIFSAEQVQQVTTSSTASISTTTRAASHTPLDPYYGDQFRGYGNTEANGPGIYTYFGQAWPMNSMGFNGAWDISDPLNINGQVAAEPVRIAIIDAGWMDYSTFDRDGFDETLIDATTSGSIAANGTFTAGLAAAEWETYVSSSDTTFFEFPLRDTGEAMLGILAANHNDYSPQIADINGDTTISEDEIWNEGMAGINPNASYTLIKTGSKTAGEDTWTFTGQEIAAAIEHAWDAADCDIILVGSFASGAVPAAVQTAITNARDNGALVIAPAGDVVDSFNGTGFDSTPVDISTTPVWPASATGCLSVTGTGFSRVGSLPDLNIGGDTVPNLGTGWFPSYTAPFNEPFTAIANYCNTGADIAGMGWGFGFGGRPNLVEGGGTEADPYWFVQSEGFNTNSTTRFSTTYPAAYVAGAASIVFQALSYANGAPPSDEEVETTLLDTINFPGMAGILNNGGYLNANAAVADGIAGGTLYHYEPSMAFTTTNLMFDWFSQNRAAVTRGTNLSVSPAIVNGTAPFTLEVDWDNGEAPVEVANWNSGDAVTLTGGYDTLGIKYVSLTVTDANGQAITIAPDIFVINPLVGSISVENAAGLTLPTPPALKANTTYRFRPELSNVFTGNIGGDDNELTYAWWFGGNPATDPADSTAEAPTFSFTSAGSKVVTFRVTESLRPDSTFTITVNVAN